MRPWIHRLFDGDEKQRLTVFLHKICAKPVPRPFLGWLTATPKQANIPTIKPFLGFAVLCFVIGVVGFEPTASAYVFFVKSLLQSHLYFIWQKLYSDFLPLTSH